MPQVISQSTCFTRADAEDGTADLCGAQRGTLCRGGGLGGIRSPMNNLHNKLHEYLQEQCAVKMPTADVREVKLSPPLPRSLDKVTALL